MSGDDTNTNYPYEINVLKQMPKQKEKKNKIQQESIKKLDYLKYCIKKQSLVNIKKY